MNTLCDFNAAASSRCGTGLLPRPDPDQVDGFVSHVVKSPWIRVCRGFGFWGTSRPTLWGLLAWLLILPSFAAVPLPDHLVYGTIAIDGRPVTRADTDTVIEARQTSTGPVIASYRMGSRTTMGDFYYSLRVPVAEAADASPGQAVLGESLVITVRASIGLAHQVVHRVTEPGVALRLDFGASVDTNGDGVSDGWELATFGTTGANLNRDTDGDSATDRAEFFAGTAVKNAADHFRLALKEEGASVQVSFRALRATGVGFEGRTRYYALESTTDPVAGPWQPIINMSRIPGSDQLVTHTEPSKTNGPAFFRARVWLE
ncbi:MAG: hypothetical protein IT581_14815 [Verrucomicrobiales bacterium]|nr:hypothetical protein [Verrucomicrobiales bacterium]